MRYIHETVLRDIIDLMQDAKDLDHIKGFQNMRSPGSISQAASNLICVFPVMCSNNLNMDSVSMVSKAIERKAASLVSLVLAAHCTNNSTDIYEYIKKFHTNLNIDTDVTVDSILATVDKCVINESANKRLTTQYVLSEQEIKTMVNRDLSNINSYLADPISENAIGDFKVLPASRYGSTVVLEAAPRTNPVKPARPSHPVGTPGSAIASPVTKQIPNPNMSSNTKTTSISNNVGSGSDILRDVSTATKIASDTVMMNKNRYTSNMVDKSNELVETLLTVNVWCYDKASGKLVPVVFMMGIKAKTVLVESTDIMNRLSNKTKDNNILLGLIRATTRETSFFKDFIFAIDKAKIDAISQSKKGSSSPLWKVLERRATKANIKRALGVQNDSMNITTLVISQEEVDYIKKDSNIDVSNERVIRPIMQSLGLLGFVIVDEATEVCRFLFDGSQDLFEVLSFSSLERESADAGAYKKAINLMSKIK